MGCNEKKFKCKYSLQALTNLYTDRQRVAGRQNFKSVSKQLLKTDFSVPLFNERSLPPARVGTPQSRSSPVPDHLDSVSIVNLSMVI